MKIALLRAEIRALFQAFISSQEMNHTESLNRGMHAILEHIVFLHGDKSNLSSLIWHFIAKLY